MSQLGTVIGCAYAVHIDMFLVLLMTSTYAQEARWLARSMKIREWKTSYVLVAIKSAVKRG
jgi:hypothetical protein